MIRKAWIGVLAMMIFSLVAGEAHAQLGSLFRRGPSVQEIGVGELHQMLVRQQGGQQSATPKDPAERSPSFVLVDVRSPEEQAVSIIPGAITQSQFEQNANRYRGRTVITYCTVGGRSGKYAAQLISKGVKAKNFKGSILGWVNAKLPLVTLDGQPTNRVHVYSSRYRVPSKYKAVW